MLEAAGFGQTSGVFFSQPTGLQDFAWGVGITRVMTSPELAFLLLSSSELTVSRTDAGRHDLSMSLGLLEECS